MTHTLTIQHKGTHNGSATADSNGDYVVALVRKSLADTQIVPASLRYNTTTKTVQRTVNGGTTWVDSTSTDDPRHNAALKKTPRTGSNIACYTAANAVHYLQTQVDDVANATDAASAIVTGIGVLASFFPEVGIFVDIFAAVVSDLLAIGSTTIVSAMTSTVYHTLRDIIACYIGADGSVTAAQLAKIQADVTSLIGGTAASVINIVLTSWGEVGLQNAGATGTLTDTCSGTICARCYKGDFTLVNVNFGGAGTGAVGGRGVYVTGYGWMAVTVGTESLLQILLALAGSGDEQIDSVDIEFDGVLTPTANYDTFSTVQHNGSTFVQTFTRTSVSGHNIWTQALTGNWKYMYISHHSNVAGQHQRIVSVTLHWHDGANAPTVITPNCP
jgi:hypothetical protein